MRVKTKIVKGWNGGHQVEFWIGNQGFKLQEVFGEGEWSSRDRAKWYKKQLDTAFEKLNALGEENSKLVEKAIAEVDGFANWFMLQQGYDEAEIDQFVKKGLEQIHKLIEQKKKELGNEDREEEVPGI